MQSNGIKLAAIAPSNTHTPFIYTATLLKNSTHIVNFMLGDRAISLFAKYGFTPLTRK
ncbi:hypothetical protein [Microcoleus sp. FACHB-831]|uniref:hypothetical protein n=1 Tax=Microcoleus sp. FACHB-831 TaxID=2692827 RepID=UPI001A7E28D2|nr:hypothetical protein [Microcoleus sp. FACHB-831]